ncbi:MAG TPA: hypothetical protein VJT73_19275 [Polyangiaceae bacterium]|nr:hypothetical protein [Polyangiaceae bacterium]
MLDPASIERLAEAPGDNDPALNVALAEEGSGPVLLALARCKALGAEAIDVIAARALHEGGSLASGEENDEARPVAEQLLQELIGHPNASRSTRDAILERRVDDPFFVFAAATHRSATRRALEVGAGWPSASPLHDRPWLSLFDAASPPPDLVASWSEQGELLREAAALLSTDLLVLDRLSADPSRRVRRAVASSAHAAALRARMAERDAAPEVRARALRSSAEPQPSGADMVQAMAKGGWLAADVRKALVGAGPSLDEEGALLGAQHLGPDELLKLVSQATAGDDDTRGPRATGVGTGLALRVHVSEDELNERAALSNEIVHLLTRHAAVETRLTGKARVALWLSESLCRSQIVDGSLLSRGLSPLALASERAVLFRWAAKSRGSLAEVCAYNAPSVPLAVVELCWRDRSISDDAAVALAARVAPAPRTERDLPEDDLDLAPLHRSLGVLERAVLAAIPRVPVSPRAALAAIASDPRRCRVVLTAMPTWKGALTGTRLARVLRSNAGALSAASRASGAKGGPRPASVARWVDRRLAETEAAIAIAVGDLTAAEAAKRLRAGSIVLADGVTLAAGIEARAAIDGPRTFEPLLDHAAAQRTQDAASLALWLLLEGLERERAPSLVASAIDGLSGSGAVVEHAVCEALATLERRQPGRLEHVHAQSPRGKGTIASAIARAYRAFGGMRDEG